MASLCGYLKGESTVEQADTAPKQASRGDAEVDLGTRRLELVCQGGNASGSFSPRRPGRWLVRTV